MSADDGGRGGTSRVDLPSVVLAVVLLGLGVTLAVDASRIEPPPGAGVVGPSVFPWAVAVALLILGVVLGLVATRGRPDEALDPLHSHIQDEYIPSDDAEQPTGTSPAEAAPEPTRPFLKGGRPLRLVVFVAGLVAHALLLQTAGYVVAALVLFVAVALAFGAPRPVRVLLVGAVLTLLIFYAFTLGLGLALPNLGGR